MPHLKCLVWKGAKGILTKGIGRHLVFFKVFSGYFQGVFRAFSEGVFRVFSGSFRVFSGIF